LLCNLVINTANKPYNIKNIIIAPVNAEYLARGPKFSTACDSNCPGVSENRVCYASSGMKGLPAKGRISSDIVIATAPAASPRMKELPEIPPDFSITHMSYT
jgi:hypothetical protein